MPSSLKNYFFSISEISLFILLPPPTFFTAKGAKHHKHHSFSFFEKIVDTTILERHDIRPPHRGW